MTTTTSTFTEARAGAGTWFSDIATGMWRTARYRFQQRRAVETLRGMTDQHLKDLGIHRSEITSVVYGDGVGRVRRFTQ